MKEILYMKEMKITDCGVFGTARKIHYKIGNDNYYFYFYKGNSLQNFVVDAEGNDITKSKIGSQIMLSGMNFIFQISKNEN